MLSVPSIQSHVIGESLAYMKDEPLMHMLLSHVEIIQVKETFLKGYLP